MLKGIKIRIYPNKKQEEYLSQLFGSYRFVYNNCLEYCQKQYELGNKVNSLKALGNYFHNVLTKTEEYKWLNEHNTKILKQSIIDLLSAYKNFFKTKKGFPNFKSKYNKQSVRFPLEAISNKFLDNESKLFLSKIDLINYSCSDKDKNYFYKNVKGIKSLTLSKTKTNKYFISILIDGKGNNIITNPINEFIGIDLGIKSYAVMSNGKTIENPKFIRNNEKKLKKLHQQLSKKQKGSKNREKARLKLARKHEKITNQKNDFLHNITNKIINENQVIILEDLNVKGMMQNHKLAKSISELSLYEFKRQLTYKANWYGREIIEIDRYFPSSKMCSCCNEVNKNLTLADRTWECSKCHTQHDRDANASINILNEGKRIFEQNRATLTRIKTPNGVEKPLENV